MRRTVIAIVLGLTALPALGQSINIDFEKPDGPWGEGVPASSFGGAASQPGTWNAVTQMGLTGPLLGLDGQFTDIVVEAVGVGVPASMDGDNSSGEFAKLMEDGLKVTSENDTLIIQVENLDPGRYFVYVYGGLLPYGECCHTLVTTSILDDAVFDEIGGYPLPPNSFRQDSTHARFIYTVSEGYPVVRLRVRRNGAFPEGRITGIQLQKLPDAIYVKATAPDGGNGHSWDTAFNDLQDGIALAREWDGEVDELWVAEGSYFATSDNNEEDYFDIPTGIAAMYGGFAGNETSRDQRDPIAHSTILSGNIGGPLTQDNTDTILRMFPSLNNPDDTALMDGFTILGGSGGFDGNGDKGAGLFVHGGELTVRNCRFIANRSETGGAVYASQGTLHFIDCSFLSNSAASTGGAFANEGIMPNPGPVAWFINCRFHNNDAGFWGGAADLTISAATFINCVFTGCDSEYQGGAIHANYSDTVVNLYGCTFAGNSSDSYGGAIGLDSGAHANISNSILWGNQGSPSWNGLVKSQISFDLSSVTATYTTVQYHTVSQLAGAGNNGLNPMFVNATGGDGYGGLNDNVRLASSSPLIDSGNNSGMPLDFGDLDSDTNFFENTPLDLDRLSRRTNDLYTADTGNGGAPLVDRGAFEFQPTPILLGDMDCNEAVDFADTPGMVMALVNPPQYDLDFGCHLNGDMNQDGLVNGDDLQGFIAALTD